MSGTGFALDEYIAPRFGTDAPIPGGTMPKSSKESGGMFSNVSKNKVPAPTHYKAEIGFAKDTKGGNFSKLDRGWGKKGPQCPAVGSYETVSSLCEPKLLGGIVPKTGRGCHHFDVAVKQGNDGQAAFGKYNTEKPKSHIRGPTFNTPRTEPKFTKKQSAVGPGYYPVSYDLVDERVPNYSAPKESGKNFMTENLKKKEFVPAPGHVSGADSKLLDDRGKRNHVKQLLASKIISPRIKPTTDC